LSFLLFDNLSAGCVVLLTYLSSAVYDIANSRCQRDPSTLLFFAAALLPIIF